MTKFGVVALRSRAIAASIALAGCATLPDPSVNLDGLLSFANPATCEQSAKLHAFMDAMVLGHSEVGFRPGTIKTSAKLTSAYGPVRIERPRDHTVASISVAGTWLGMRVTKIQQWFPDGGDPGGFGIELDTPVEEARRRLVQAGFPVAGEEAEVIDDYDYTIHISLTPAKGGGALFACDVS